jgi:4-carboxymuconolactone decarboxylase
MGARRAVVLPMLLAGLMAPALAGAQERMPPIPADKMTDAQKKAVAEYKAIRGTDLTGPPWSVLLRVPDQVVPALQIRMHYLNKSVLGPHLTEFAILLGARRWTNNWEWNAHAPAAETAGVKREVIAALAEGRRPDAMSEEEAVAYDLSAELQSNQSVSDGTYAKALAKFGEAGVVELASIQGYYTYLAMVMNAARVGVQQNARPPLERFPH